MDPDKIKRRQSLKIIISEAVMVVSVVITVIVLAFLVSGYWINSDFKVERQGLLQISSTPTGADVDIDGDSSWLQRTNTSKVLSAGKHTITLTKDGYDSWSRTINISEGLLYRLHYPRLFLQNTTAEEILDIDTTAFHSFSPDGNKLLSINNLTTWELVELSDNVVKTTNLDVSTLFLGYLAQVPDAVNFGEVLSLDWSQDNNHALLSIQIGSTTEWILLDTRNAEKSVNLTNSLGYTLSQVQILDHSASTLLAIVDGSLHKIDVSSRSLSPAFAQDVTSYSLFGADEVVFSAADTESDADGDYYIGKLKLNDEKVTKFMNTAMPVQAVVSKFYDDKYLTVLQDNAVSLYLYSTLDKKSEYRLGFAPTNIKVGNDGSFTSFYSGAQIASLDMEAESVAEWATDSAEFGWIDGSIIYSVDAQGGLAVYDFDGLNRRVIADNATHHAATITADKWLYYFSDNHLMRKLIAD